MTKNKARKKLVRQRTEKTGESYTSALRQLLANKEKSVTTATEKPTTHCARCRTEDDGSTNFVVAGLTFCQTCHDDITSAVQKNLDSDATRTRRPLGYFMSALVVVPEGEGWVVHLHTLQPGSVIGREGATAERIRESLIAVKGDDKLRLNVISHEVFGCARSPEPT